MQTEKLEELMRTEPSNKEKTNVPFYDILANQAYKNMFEYDSIFNTDCFEDEEGYKNKIKNGDELLTPTINLGDNSLDESEEDISHFHDESRVTLIVLNLVFLAKE